jgi:hypothetical protein
MPRHSGGDGADAAPECGCLIKEGEDGVTIESWVWALNETAQRMLDGVRWRKYVIYALTVLEPASLSNRHEVANLSLLRTCLRIRSLR